MKKVTVIGLALALVIGLGVTSSWAGAYFSGNVGAVWLDDSDLDDGIDTGELSFDTGYAVTAAMGASYDCGARAEVEFGYRRNDTDELTIDGLGSGSIDGDMSATSLMGNVFYGVPAGVFSPFIGAGAGFANVKIDLDDVGDEDDTVFAYQFMAGAGLAVNPALTIDVQYRYFATSDPEFDGMDAEYSSHNVMLGLRTEF